MSAPCACGHCRLCALFATDARYRAFWNGRPATRRALPCVHLGRLLDPRGTPCPLDHVRQCDRHATCTLRACQSCPDYEPEE
jgi:hypothetical protein